MPRLRFAGQITGCEGYVESAAVGLIAGRFAAAERLGATPRAAARDDGDRRAAQPHHGRAHRDIDAGPPSFQPMNVNFGLFPPLEAAPRGEDGKRLRGPAKGIARKLALTGRAKADLEAWLARPAQVAAE